MIQNRPECNQKILHKTGPDAQTGGWMLRKTSMRRRNPMPRENQNDPLRGGRRDLRIGEATHCGWPAP
jgi:hypothetical protein